jgi:hypothetical protein
MKTSLAIVLAVATLTIGTVSVAQEQTLKGRLVVTQPTGTSTALPSYGGHTFNANKYSGVAVFEDGRVAYKQYIESSDDTEAGGDFKGYSIYTFQNGDSLTMSYTGGWKGTVLLVNTRSCREPARMLAHPAPEHSRALTSPGKMPRWRTLPSS